MSQQHDHYEGITEPLASKIYGEILGKFEHKWCIVAINHNNEARVKSILVQWIMDHFTQNVQEYDQNQTNRSIIDYSSDSGISSLVNYHHYQYSD